MTRRKRIHYRIRKDIKGTASRPRLSVYRSNREIYAQLIDDVAGNTICSASSKQDTPDAKGNKVSIASEVGKALAAKAKDNDINRIVFDRSGYLYHGRVKALADGAREGGLVF